MTRSRAFTMVEILVVMAILGVVATFGYVKFASFNERWGLDRLADSVYNSIRAAGNISTGEDHPLRVSVNLDDDRMKLELCKYREESRCDVNDDPDWGPVSGLEPVEASESTVFHKFTNRNDDTVHTTGTQEFVITPDGVARAKTDDKDSTFFAIHLTRKPIPDESKRCKFRTVAIFPNTIQPRRYDFGRYDPFDVARPDC